MFSGMQYIYEVYKTRSFSKAAQNLYISQPSLSASVKKIEDRLGAPVFDRSTNPIQLTDCGWEYIRTAEKIMDLENSFANYLSNINELKTGSLKIGGSSYFSSFILPPFISEFTDKYPAVQFSLIESTTAALEKELLAGNLDLIIDNYNFSDAIYRRRPFSKDHLLLAVPASFGSNEHVKEYRLTSEDIINDTYKKTKGVSLKHFENDPFVFLRSGNDTRIRSEKICHNHHIHPHIVLKLDQQVTAYNVSCYGMGISFISDSLIKRVQPNDHILFYKLDDEEATQNVYFYYKKNKYVTRAMEEFLKIASAK